MTERQKFELIVGPSAALFGAVVGLGVDGLRWCLGLLCFLAGISLFIRSGVQWLYESTEG